MQKGGGIYYRYPVKSKTLGEDVNRDIQSSRKAYVNSTTGDIHTFENGPDTQGFVPIINFETDLEKEFDENYANRIYTPSDEIVNYIKETEGFSSQPYADGKGIRTIGYGFTSPDIIERHSRGISRKDADHIFANELNSRVNDLKKYS